jgi:hypothetical protein
VPRADDRAAALHQNALICVPPPLISKRSIAEQIGGYVRPERNEER